jgi:hypothetical protein
MNSRKLQRTDEELAQQQGTEHRHAAREFGSVEELLRHDAAQTSLPPEIAARLQESIAKERSTETSWWRRMFGR